MLFFVTVTELDLEMYSLYIYGRGDRVEMYIGPGW